MATPRIVPATELGPVVQQPTHVGAWLTVEQAAQLMGVGRSTVYSLMDAGRLRYVKFGRNRRVTTEFIEEFGRACECGGWALPPQAECGAAGPQEPEIQGLAGRSVANDVASRNGNGAHKS